MHQNVRLPLHATADTRPALPRQVCVLPCHALLYLIALVTQRPRRCSASLMDAQYVTWMSRRPCAQPIGLVKPPLDLAPPLPALHQLPMLMVLALRLRPCVLIMVLVLTRESVSFARVLLLVLCLVQLVMRAMMCWQERKQVSA